MILLSTGRGHRSQTLISASALWPQKNVCIKNFHYTNFGTGRIATPSSRPFEGIVRCLDFQDLFPSEDKSRGKSPHFHQQPKTSPGDSKLEANVFQSLGERCLIPHDPNNLLRIPVLISPMKLRPHLKSPPVCIYEL